MLIAEHSDMAENQASDSSTELVFLGVVSAVPIAVCEYQAKPAATPVDLRQPSASEQASGTVVAAVADQDSSAAHLYQPSGPL